jgi:hypothetical protein
MSGTTYSTYMAPAFVGMKSDSMEDNVDTFACGAANVDVGVAVQRTAAGALTVKNGASATLGVGIALHDHIIGYYGNYRQYDAVSVLTRGRAWVALADATGVVDGALCKADATTGKFSTTGAVAVTNAVFRSAAISLLNMDGVSTTLGAVVEMHSPWVDNIGASI